MKIALDSGGKVLSFGDSCPDVMNGVTLTVVELNEAQAIEFKSALGGAGVIWDGSRFAQIPKIPLVPTRDEIDAVAAKQHAKLQALMSMTPAQVSGWVDANVTNLAQVQDAIKTLAIAVSVLARRL